MPVFLQELFTVKKAGEEVLLIQDSDEEHASPERRWEANVEVSDGDLGLHFVSLDKTEMREIISTNIFPIKMKKTNTWIQKSNQLGWIPLPS